MRWALAVGLIFSFACQTSMPVSAADPFTGGIGQGFTSGLGWGLCSVVGKGIMKAGRAIKGRKHKDDSAQSQDNQQWGPEDYYNRGLEEGYARAREDGYGRGVLDNYSRGREDLSAEQTEGGYGARRTTSVHARRLVANRSGNQKQATVHRTSPGASRTHSATNATSTARQTTGNGTTQQLKTQVARLDNVTRKKLDTTGQTGSP